MALRPPNTPDFSMPSGSAGLLPVAEASVTSLDLPADIQRMLQIPGVDQSAAGPLSTEAGPASFASFHSTSMAPTSYAAGGQVGPNGMAIRPPSAMVTGAPPSPNPGGVGMALPGAPGGGQVSPQMLEANIRSVMQKNPQGVQQLARVIQQALQSGELTQDELHMISQLASVAAQNPSMYPHLRKFAIQQGLAGEDELPQQYDQGLVFALLLAVRVAEQQAGGQDMIAGGGSLPGAQPQAAGQPPVASMRSGGALPSRSKNADGSVPITAHEGEYVIPKHVVAAKGTEFFDKLIGQYTGEQKK